MNTKDGRKVKKVTTVAATAPPRNSASGPNTCFSQPPTKPTRRIEFHALGRASAGRLPPHGRQLLQKFLHYEIRGFRLHTEVLVVQRSQEFAGSGIRPSCQGHGYLK